MVMVEGALRLAEPSVGLGGFGGGALASPKALEPPKREPMVEASLFLGGEAMVEAPPGAAEPKGTGGRSGSKSTTTASMWRTKSGRVSVGAPENVSKRQLVAQELMEGSLHVSTWVAEKMSSAGPKRRGEESGGWLKSARQC